MSHAGHGSPEDVVRRVAEAGVDEQVLAAFRRVRRELFVPRTGLAPPTTTGLRAHAEACERNVDITSR
jgi:protein-L-isoaspartate O-methyltransferase